MSQHYGLQENSLKNLISTQKPLGYGKYKVKLKQPKQKEDIEDISITTFQMNPLPQKEESSMPEFLLTNKNWTLKDKLLFCKNNIPTLKLSKTLDQDLISTVEDSRPFWNPSLKPTYNKLWLPIETDCVDLDSIFLKNSLYTKGLPSLSYQIKISKNLFMNSQRTSYQSLRFSQPDIIVPENIQYCQKLRIYPNKKQLEIFNKFLGASRFFYNISVARIEQELHKNNYSIFNKGILRNLVMKIDKNISSDDPMIWQKEIPFQTKNEAINEAIIAYKAAFTNLRNKNINHFKVGFRSKKMMTNQSFKVCPDTFNFKDVSIFPTRLKEHKNIRMRKKTFAKLQKLGEVNQYFSVLKTKPDKWYICIPRIKEQPIYNNPVYKSVFLDPGVRTFQTFYSPDGICGKIENGTIQKQLAKLAKKHDLLQSIKDKCDVSKTKSHLKNRCASLRHKIKSKIDNLHWQTCSLLCKTFQNIFIPNFEVSKMVKDSPLGSNITRKMLTLSHGKFIERLKWYGSTKNRNIYLVNEHYTTKTCGICGTINPNVGSNETFNCSCCHHTIDRDLGAARNICLRFVTKFI